MTNAPHPVPSDRSQLLLDFPIRFYTALRTIRLYPATNPQVQRSNVFVMQLFQALQGNSGEDSIILAVSDQKLLVCGEQLAEKEQNRPQIQGLITLFSRAKIHSLSFQPSFSFEECIRLTQTLSSLLGEKEIAESVAVLLDKAGIVSVTVDAKRYVAIHEGEQVVREDLLNAGLSISDEELASFVLGTQTDGSMVQGVSKELIQELINRLPASGTPGQHPEAVTTAVIDYLQKISREQDSQQRSHKIAQTAGTLSALDPSLLARLVADLPESNEAEAVLSTALNKLSPQRLNALIGRLITAQANRTTGGDTSTQGAQLSVEAALQRLVELEPDRQPEISRAVAQNIDARQLLNPGTTLAELPDHLLARLVQPEWSAPVIASAAQQVAAAKQGEPGNQVDLSSFNRMLGQYEQLLDREQQTQVARQAGAQLASMEGTALGNIIAQKFKGLFGEQLYEEVINQVSDELLDETIDHLSPKQLNRMIAALTSDIPLQVGKDSNPDLKPADDVLLKRLAQTRKGPEITRAVAQNIDARQLLLNPDTTLAQLPDHLLERLQQPEWSAPVIASAAQQVAEGQGEPGKQIDFSNFNRMLGQYEQLLDREQQTQVARQAGAQLASMEGTALGNIIAQKFKGLFGEQLYEEVINQVSDELLDETIDHLSPKQLNRMVATLVSDIPLQVGKDSHSDFRPADDALLKRLAQTRKGPEITRAVAQNIDARQLLLNPDTTLAQLPDHLRERLQQPEWSAPVIASAAQQVAEGQGEPERQIDFSAFNRMLGQYEQMLDRERQTEVARQAGAQLASLEGTALGNIIAQKFKGLFGNQLYEQVITQVSDELLDETIEQLTPKQLNRMVATLISDIPLHIGKDGDPDFKPADDTVLKRLAQTRKGPEINKAVALNIDARQLLLNPPSSLEELPEQLRERLRQPEWSAPVIASAAQQVIEGQEEPGNQINFSAFNRMLGQYEQLFDHERQTQVARQAGAQLASMEGTALGNIIAQKFKGLFGEQLYEQVVTQVSDELLDETVDHLTPKQLNRMVATLISDIPLHVGKGGDPDFKPADDALLKRLTRTRKGPEITKAVALNIDARQLLHTREPTPQTSDQLSMRLQQPAWSAPVLVAAAQQVLDQRKGEPGSTADLSAFEQLLERYNNQLNSDKQLQVATQAGSLIATFEDQELGLLLVQKYKNLFGEKLYQQVIGQLSQEKLSRLTVQLQDIAEGRAPRPADFADAEIEEAYKRLMETVRGEKMRAIVELHNEQKKQQEQTTKATIDSSLDNLLRGDFKELAKIQFVAALPETARNLLLDNRGETADSLLMHLAVALQNQQPTIRENAFRALAATAEQLAHIGQWERFAKLLPALQQGLQNQGADAASCQQALTAIGALTGHYLTQEQYVSAFETTHFLQTLATGPVDDSCRIPQAAKETLRSICTKPVLQQLLDRYLHSEEHQDTAGKLLVELGPESAQFQLQQLFDSESRFERKRLLALIKQTGNPAISLLLEQLHKDAPWFVLRNAIRLLGELGNPALFSKVRPFIRHSDPRVQQEVIGTAIKIGGDHLRDFLLHALQNVDDSLKIKVINHVAITHDERFVRPLTDLLESAKPFLGKNKTDLQVSICKTLGAIGSKRASASLNRVVQSKNVLGLTGYNDDVRQAAAQALEQIQQSSSEQRQSSSEQPHQRNEAGLSTAAASSTDRLDAEEKIFQLAEQGEQQQAKKQLLDLIGTTARSGDLATAERLRERLYEIDAAPLSDIIRSDAIIEQEKEGTSRGEHLEIWAELTDRLGTREFQTIYDAFTEKRYAPEETIVSQGDKNDNLFFINQGSIKVSHLVGSRELFITSLSRGQLAGENFFTSTLWTVTLTSLTPSQVYILPQSALAQWQEQFPALRAKLHEYYRAYNNIGSMLKKKGLDRRKDKRFMLSRKIQVQPISNLDAPIGRGFRAETADISMGGLAFLIRITRQENARLLLGRRMQIVLPVGGKIGHLNFKGLVIGAQPFQQRTHDFSVHFKFDRPLDSQELQAILG
jgi:CRP-like cAMP-binding protein